LKHLLTSPNLTDEVLEKAFHPCIVSELPACKHIIAQHGMRLPQDAVDRALLEHIEDNLFAIILEGTNVNPHRYGHELFAAYQRTPNQYLLPPLMACPKFDPTVDDNAWLRYFVGRNHAKETILMLSDARVTAVADITALMNLAMQEDYIRVPLILAAHPRADLNLIDHSYPTRAHNHLISSSSLIEIAKSNDGMFTFPQIQAVLKLRDLDWIGASIQFALLYASLCSGNLEMIKWLQENIYHGKFKGTDLNILFYGEPRLQMACTAACHGHLHLIKYLLKDDELEEEELNRLLDVAHKANQFSISDWIITLLRSSSPDLNQVYVAFDHFIKKAILPPSEFVEAVVGFAKTFNTYYKPWPAISRQIIRDLEYHLSLAGLLYREIPKDIAVLIAEAVRQYPMPITEHI
jgi:hypothetical protein